MIRRHKARIRASFLFLAFAGGVTVACVTEQANSGHCASESGDATCVAFETDVIR